MGKYKKYTQTEQNLELIKNNPSENKMALDQTENSKCTKNKINRRKDKKDDGSLITILLEILEAMKYFFIMTKNFIIPNNISLKTFIIFLILEIIYQGMIIYIIKRVLFLLEKYFSIWDDIFIMYIHIISYTQMIFIFICEFLLIFRFLQIKIYLYNSLNWLINILTCAIIFINAYSVNELTGKVYQFHSNNREFQKEYYPLIKEYYVTEYINLYVNLEDNFKEFELCIIMKYNKPLFKRLQGDKLTSFFKWQLDKKNDLITGCKNVSITNNPFTFKYHNMSFFNCYNKDDENTAANYCVSNKFRQQRFYAHCKIGVFEIIIMVLWNIYNSFSLELIYHYFPFLSQNCENCINKKNKNYQGNNYSKANKNKYIYQVVTYKDINDGEIFDKDNFDSGDENEDDEADEEAECNDEENDDEETEIIKEFKSMRKISKKKMKSFKKKKRKNKYKQDKKSKNKKYTDIIDEDFDDDENDSDDSDNYEEEDDITTNKYCNNYCKFNIENDEKENEEKGRKNREWKEKGEEENHALNKLYVNYISDVSFGKVINPIKNKLHKFLVEIDKHLSKDED